MTARATLLAQLADHLAAVQPGHPLRVGIDGVCGSGKSTLARDLAATLRERGVDAVHLDSDGFHQPRAVRYRQGRDSARGYYEDAYDFDALAARVLEPLGTGPGTYATQVHDLETDALVADAVAVAGPDTVVVFDCTFLQRGSLRDLWDEVIYLDVDRATAVRRGVVRDAERLGGVEAATAAYESRYMAACDIYLAEEHPRERAGIVVEYSDPEDPTIRSAHGSAHPPLPTTGR